MKKSLYFIKTLIILFLFSVSGSAEFANSSSLEDDNKDDLTCSAYTQLGNLRPYIHCEAPVKGTTMGVNIIGGDLPAIGANVCYDSEVLPAIKFSQCLDGEMNKKGGFLRGGTSLDLADFATVNGYYRLLGKEFTYKENNDTLELWSVAQGIDIKLHHDYGYFGYNYHTDGDNGFIWGVQGNLNEWNFGLDLKGVENIRLWAMTHFSDKEAGNNNKNKNKREHIIRYEKRIESKPLILPGNDNLQTITTRIPTAGSPVVNYIVETRSAINTIVMVSQIITTTVRSVPNDLTMFVDVTFQITQDIQMTAIVEKLVRTTLITDVTAVVRNNMTTNLTVTVQKPVTTLVTLVERDVVEVTITREVINDVTTNITVSIYNEIRATVETTVISFITTTIRHDVTNNITSEVTVEILRQMTTIVTNEITTVISKEVTTTITQMATTTVTMDITTKITNQIERQITTEITTIVTNQTTMEVIKEITTKITTQITTTVENNITTEITKEITVNITNNITNDVLVEITVDITFNVTNNVTNEITIQITNNITNEIFSEITTKITNNITNRITNAITVDVFNNITNNITNEITVEITNKIIRNITNNITSILINSVTAHITVSEKTIITTTVSVPTVVIVPHTVDITTIQDMTITVDKIITTTATVETILRTTTTVEVTVSMENNVFVTMSTEIPITVTDLVTVIQRDTNTVTITQGTTLTVNFPEYSTVYISTMLTVTNELDVTSYVDRVVRTTVETYLTVQVLNDITNQITMTVEKKITSEVTVTMRSPTITTRVEIFVRETVYSTVVMRENFYITVRQTNDTIHTVNMTRNITSILVNTITTRSTVSIPSVPDETTLSIEQTLTVYSFSEITNRISLVIQEGVNTIFISILVTATDECPSGGGQCFRLPNEQMPEPEEKTGYGIARKTCRHTFDDPPHYCNYDLNYATEMESRERDRLWVDDRYLTSTGGTVFIRLWANFNSENERGVLNFRGNDISRSIIGTICTYELDQGNVCYSDQLNVFAPTFLFNGAGPNVFDHTNGYPFLDISENNIIFAPERGRIIPTAIARLNAHQEIYRPLVKSNGEFQDNIENGVKLCFGNNRAKGVYIGIRSNGEPRVERTAEYTISGIRIENVVEPEKNIDFTIKVQVLGCPDLGIVRYEGVPW